MRREVDEQLLSALIKAMPPDAAKILRVQLSRVTFVKYGPRDFDYGARFRGYLDAATDVFPCKDEIELGVVEFEVPRVEGRWTARFSSMNGRLSTMVIRPSPKRIRRARRIEVRKVVLRDDPMKPSAFLTSLTGWVGEWARAHNAHHISGPMAEHSRDTYISKIPAALPADYLEIIEQSEGFVFGDAFLWKGREVSCAPCTVGGLNDVYLTHLEDGDYFLLGQIHDVGMVGVREGDTDGMVWFVDFDGSDPEPCGTSFREAVDKLTAQYARERLAGKEGCLRGLLAWIRRSGK